MSLITSTEVAVLNAVAGQLSADASEIENVLGPIEVIAVADGLKIADEQFAKLPDGLGAFLDAELANAAKLFAPAELNGFVGQGIAGLVAYLKALAVKVAA